MKTCFNCQNQFNYVAECPYENREDHGGKLVYKSAAKAPIKEPYFKKNFPQQEISLKDGVGDKRRVHRRGQR